MNDKLELIQHTISQALKPRELLSPIDFIESKIILPPTVSPSSHGPLKLRYYQQDIIDAMCSQDTSLVVVSISAQLAKTTLVNAFLLHMIYNNPTSTIVALPNKELVARRSKTLEYIIQASPELSPLIHRHGRLKSTKTRIAFDGGFIELGSARSSSFTSDISAKNIILDEVDRFYHNPDGDPIRLLIERASSLPDAKIIAVSTPTFDGSHIDTLTKQCDIYEPRIKCPYCSYHIHLSLHQTQDDYTKLIYNDSLTDIHYICSSCHRQITESQRRIQLRNTFAFVNTTNKDISRKAFTKLSHLYDINKSTKSILEKYIHAKNNNDPDEIRVFYNNVIGVSFKHLSHSNDMQKHMTQISDNTQSLTFTKDEPTFLGVDLQKDRIESTLIRVHSNGHIDILEHCVFNGFILEDFVFDELKDYITHANPTRTLIDYRGYDEHHQLAQIRKLRHLQVFPTRGYSGNAPSQDFVTYKNSIFIANTVKLKDLIFAKLDSSYITFNDTLTHEFHLGFLSEKYDIKKRKYVKIRERNEALDTTVYALASYYSYNRKNTSQQTQTQTHQTQTQTTNQRTKYNRITRRFARLQNL